MATSRGVNGKIIFKRVYEDACYCLIRHFVSQSLCSQGIGCSYSINPDTDLGDNVTTLGEVFNDKTISILFNRVQEGRCNLELTRAIIGRGVPIAGRRINTLARWEKQLDQGYGSISTTEQQRIQDLLEARVKLLKWSA